MSNAYDTIADPEKFEKSLSPSEAFQIETARRKYIEEVLRNCGNCKHCTDADYYENDGICELGCSSRDGGRYTFLDDRACGKFESKNDIRIDNQTSK